MMTIIQIDPIMVQDKYELHPIQSQSGRDHCWLDGWIEVPEDLVKTAWDTTGYCKLTIENGVLTGITPGEKPEVTPDPAEPNPIDQLRADVDFIALMGGIEL